MSCNLKHKASLHERLQQQFSCFPPLNNVNSKLSIRCSSTNKNLSVQHWSLLFLQALVSFQGQTLEGRFLVLAPRGGRDEFPTLFLAGTSRGSESEHTCVEVFGMCLSC